MWALPVVPCSCGPCEDFACGTTRLYPPFRLRSVAARNCVIVSYKHGSSASLNTLPLPPPSPPREHGLGVEEDELLELLPTLCPSYKAKASILALSKIQYSAHVMLHSPSPAFPGSNLQMSLQVLHHHLVLGPLSTLKLDLPLVRKSNPN